MLVCIQMYVRIYVYGCIKNVFLINKGYGFDGELLKRVNIECGDELSYFHS